MDFNHHPILTTNFDPIGAHHDNEIVIDNGNAFEIAIDKLPVQNNSIEIMTDQVKLMWISFGHTTFKWSVITATIIVMTLVILYLLRYRKTQHTVMSDVNDILIKMHWLSSVGRPSVPIQQTRQPIEMISLME